jgi:NADH-quinone oxidoreductase subunit G
MVKTNGSWKQVDWQTALERVVGGLNDVLQKHGSDSVAALVSPNATTEEMYLTQKLIRNLDSNNIDHRLRQTDFSDDANDAAFPELGREIASLEALDATLLIGCNLRKELPLAAVRLRKSTFTGKISVINQQDYPFNFKLAVKQIVAADSFANELAGVLKAAAGDKLDASWNKLVASVEVTESQQQTADLLNNGDETAIILGSVAQSHPEYANLRAIAKKLAEVTGASCGLLSQGGNSAGAYLAGAVPHRKPGADISKKPGKNVTQMYQDGCKAYLLMNVEPGADSADAELALEAMQQAEFVVSLNNFADGEIAEYADVMLPMAAFTETSGSYVNLNGVWQSFKGAVAPQGEARPAWKILRVLGNFMEFEGFDFESSEQILAEMEAALAEGKSFAAADTKAPKSLKSIATQIKETGIYEVDGVVRRAASLQATADGQAANVAKG